MKPATRNYDDKRRDLLDAARYLFAQHGFDGASTRKIAERARANIGLIAYYFGSKEALFEAVITEWVEQLADELQRGLTGDDAIDNFLRIAVIESPEGTSIVARELIGAEISPRRRGISEALQPVIDFFDSKMKLPEGGNSREIVALLLGIASAAGAMPSLLVSPDPASRDAAFVRAHRWAHAALKQFDLPAREDTSALAARAFQTPEHDVSDFLD